jgi:hypothetical protein
VHPTSGTEDDDDPVAEFLLYLIRQSEKSAIDPITAANRNLLENANKFTEL